MERKKITFDSFIRGTICCVLIIGLLMLVERLSGVLLPFFIAWLIAYMVYPLVKFFQYKLRLKSRIISIFCSLFLITVIGVTLFYLLVPPMISEIGRMNDLLVTYLTNGAGNNVPKNLSEFIHENIDLQALNRVLSEEEINAKDHAYEVDPNSEGLVAYWKLNDGLDEIKDYSVNGNNATPSSTLTWVDVALPAKED